MKLIKSLLIAAFALTLVVGTVVAEEKKAEAKKQSCCEKAKAKGQECTHKCCVAAKKDGKICEKCNPKADKADKSAKAEKTADKK